VTKCIPANRFQSYRGVLEGDDLLNESGLGIKEIVHGMYGGSLFSKEKIFNAKKLNKLLIYIIVFRSVYMVSMFFIA